MIRTIHENAMPDDGRCFYVTDLTQLSALLTDAGAPIPNSLLGGSILPLLFADQDGLVPRRLILWLSKEFTRMATDLQADLRAAVQHNFAEDGRAGLSAFRTAVTLDLLKAPARGLRLTRSATSVTIDGTVSPPRISVDTATPVTASAAAGHDASADRIAAALEGVRFTSLDRVFEAKGRDTHISACRWPTSDPLEDACAVRRVVAATLPRTRPTVERVATQFGTSSRTLQRVLQRWGVTFEEIVDQTRHLRALDLVANTQTSMVEVAFLLGYSDQPHFNRAFRRWTGMTPRAYRLDRSPTRLQGRHAEEPVLYA